MKDRCFKCGKPTFGHGVMAQLCSQCAIKYKDKCVSDSKPTFGHGVMAQLCSQCAIKYKDKCVVVECAPSVETFS